MGPLRPCRLGATRGELTKPLDLRSEEVESGEQLVTPPRGLVLRRVRVGVRVRVRVGVRFRVGVRLRVRVSFGFGLG